MLEICKIDWKFLVCLKIYWYVQSVEGSSAQSGTNFQWIIFISKYFVFVINCWWWTLLLAGEWVIVNHSISNPTIWDACFWMFVFCDQLFTMFDCLSFCDQLLTIFDFLWNVFHNMRHLLIVILWYIFHVIYFICNIFYNIY